MSATLRLLLAIGTLTTFWLGLFISTAANLEVDADADGRISAAVGESTAAGFPVASDGLDAAALDALQVQSRDAFVAGDWTSALEPTKTLVQRFPGQHVYLARLAEIHNKLGQTVDEAAAWELFMDRAPLPADACPQLGNAYRRLGKYDLALSAFERCFAADTKNAELAFFVGLGNEWLAKFEAAKTFYERAIKMATVHYDSEVGLARLRLHRNQLVEALSQSTAVLRKVPSHVDALLVAGLAQQRAGRRREARVHLEKAARLSEDYFDVQLALGILDYSESRVAAARKRFEIAQKLDPKRQEELHPWLVRTAGTKVAS